MTKDKEILLKKLRFYLKNLYFLAALSFVGMFIMRNPELGSISGSLVFITLPIILFMDKMKKEMENANDKKIL